MTHPVMQEGQEKKPKELPPPFHKRLVADEVKFLKMALHPTNRSDSKDMTKRIIRYLLERGEEEITSLEIQRDVGISETPVLKRLKVLTQFRLIKKEANRYYRVGPRLKEFVKLYLEGM